MVGKTEDMDLRRVSRTVWYVGIKIKSFIPVSLHLSRD